MTTVETQCCESDLCNSQEPPALPESSTNGKKCFTCAADDNCTSTLECKGSEDRCFMVTLPAVGMVKGCVSQSLCSGSLIAAAIGDCCEGNLCNNALRIGQSILFLLLVPLASFFLFN
ncbi:urokinase plasminogen activator surface receptor-like [Conger conger]|uniref:urokinase plasminogen activator surface receptor-like n=1 Tax=Conger conger TaxID=82655 RepID=UPI002A59FAA5|nr:urokinase plasminogen activator surface receptor-like [Conger conger]